MRAEKLCAMRRKRKSRSGRSCRNETEREGERGEVAMGERGSTEPTRLSGYAVCRQATLLHIGSNLLPFSRTLIHLSHFLFLSSTRPSSFLHVCLFLSLSPFLVCHAALVRSHSRSPLRCLWSPGSSLLALVRSIDRKSVV